MKSVFLMTKLFIVKIISGLNNNQNNSNLQPDCQYEITIIYWAGELGFTLFFKTPAVMSLIGKFKPTESLIFQQDRLSDVHQREGNTGGSRPSGETDPQLYLNSDHSFPWRWGKRGLPPPLPRDMEQSKLLHLRDVDTLAETGNNKNTSRHLPAGRTNHHTNR